ncbi:MAG: peptidyl-prolyl cis-trans isomerase [Planctomycetota bacterium]
MQFKSTLLRRRFAARISVFALLFFFCSPLVALQEPAQQTVSPRDLPGETVVATVDDQVVTAGEVRRFLNERFKHLAEAQRNAALLRPEILASGLQQLIDRKIVFLKMVEDGTAYSDESVAVEIAKFERELQVVGETLDQWLEKQAISRSHFEFEVRWRLSWKRLLDRSLSDQALENYYNFNRRKFDGTELQVAHILFQDTSSESAAKMNRLRDDLSNGTVSWTDAVTGNSDAPSSNDNGLVGWININGPMDPKFTAAAFELEPGEISEVTHSPFGIHLIKCMDVNPGKNEFRDVIDKVRSDATEYGFRQIVTSTRDSRTVVREADWPHFDDDGNLIVPGDGNPAEFDSPDASESPDGR